MNNYFECNAEIIVENPEGIIRLIEKVYGQRKLLIYQNNLSPDFFDLSTGLAGELLQKLVNYQIQTAFVVDTESIKSERFKELIYEVNQNSDYRFFENKDEALDWFTN